MFRVFFFLLLFAQLASAESLVGEADLSFSKRSSLARADVDQAITLYRKALELEPENFEIYFKLIEALYFKGYYISKDQSEKEEIFAEQLKLSEKTLMLLSQVARVDLFELKLSERVSKVKHLKYSAPAYFWNSISWGLWGMTFGNFASARKSVATKVRDAAWMLSRIDPLYASAGGYRLLGRLHTKAPKIPFFTYWVDRDYGIKLLRKANSISTSDPRNQFFLADALLEYQPDKDQEALNLLREVSKRLPDKNYYIEQLETISEAQSRLGEYEKR